jgi:glycosidase
MQMRGDMLFWVKGFGIDGFRCDDVGNTADLPFAFWKWVRPQLRVANPRLFMLAAVDQPLLCPTFDSTYMRDLQPLLWKICAGNAPATAIDDVLRNEAGEFPPDSIIMRFMDNHDWHSSSDWVGGNGPGPDPSYGMAQVAPLMVLCATLPGKPLIYNGQEMSFERVNPPADASARLQSPVWPFYCKLCALYRDHPAVYEGEFRKVATSNDAAIYAFVRQRGSDKALIVVNLSASAQSVVLHDSGLTGKCMDWFGGATLAGFPSTINLSAWGYKAYVLN